MTRLLSLEIDADGIASLVLGAPDSRTIVFTPGLQAEFVRVLDRLEAELPRALIISSAHPRIFLAGADLEWIASLPDRDAAEQFSHHGQRVLHRIAVLPFPVVGAIHGACAGGGYELALACSYRVASDAPETRIGLPETRIGTIPGWGGCVRLPRLIGAAAALEHILAGELLPSESAHGRGLVDERVEAAGLLPAAKERALALAGRSPGERRSPPEPAPDWYQHLRQSVRLRDDGLSQVRLGVIEVVEQGLHLGVGPALALEAKVFASVTVNEICRQKIGEFFQRKKGDRPK